MARPDHPLDSLLYAVVELKKLAPGEKGQDKKLQGELEIIGKKGDQDASTYVKISAGDFETKSSLKLEYLAANDEESSSRIAEVCTRYKEATKDYDEDPAVLLSISFELNDSIDVFEVGELSGGINNLLSVALTGTKLKYKIARKMRTDSAGKRLFVLSIAAPEAKDVAESITTLTEFYKFLSLVLTLDLSLAPKPPQADAPTEDKQDFLKFSLEFSAKTKRSLINLVALLMKEKMADAAAVFTESRRVHLELEFDDLADFWSQLPSAVTPINTINFDEILKTLVDAKYFAILVDEKTPEPVRNVYTQSRTFFKSLHSIQLCTGGNRMLSLSFQDFNIFTMLPSIDDLKTAQTTTSSGGYESLLDDSPGANAPLLNASLSTGSSGGKTPLLINSPNAPLLNASLSTGSSDGKTPLLSNSPNSTGGSGSYVSILGDSTSKAEVVFKVAVMGEPNTGKTSIMSQYVHGRFTDTYKATTTLACAEKTISVGANRADIDIWDLGKHERFLSTYMKGALAWIFVFDVTNLESFQAVEKWLQAAEESHPTGTTFAPIVVAGTKIDVDPSKRVVSKTQAESYVQTRLGDRGTYVEVSAKDGESTRMVFENEAILQNLSQQFLKKSS